MSVLDDLTIVDIASNKLQLFNPIGPGESCVLTTACLRAFEDYSAEGIAESDVQAVAIPMRIFDELVSQSTQFS